MGFKTTLDALQDKEYRICGISETLDFFSYNMVRSSTDDSTLVIIGPNGCGKSLMGKLVEAVLRNEGMACRSAAVRNRTASGVEKAIVYGDESRQSTGLTSVLVCNLAMKSAAGSNEPSAIIYDEPDLGLSDGYSIALGREMGAFARHNPQVNNVVISHNRPLVRAFLEGYESSAVNLIAFEPYPCDLLAWLDTQDSTVSYQKLLELAVSAYKTEQSIDDYLNRN